METAPHSSQRQPELLGQTVVVIGGSAGIGLETARRARVEGANVILTGRDPDRLRRAGRELGAQRTAAFDAEDVGSLAQFFHDLPTPIDHVMVTAGGFRHRAAARDGLGPGARWAQRPRGFSARGRTQHRGPDQTRGHPVAHGWHRRPEGGSRPRDRVCGHRRATPVRRGPGPRAGAGSCQPDRRRIRRYPLSASLPEINSRPAGTSCGPRYLSAASWVRPTSRPSPCTS